MEFFLHAATFLHLNESADRAFPFPHVFILRHFCVSEEIFTATWRFFINRQPPSLGRVLIRSTSRSGCFGCRFAVLDCKHPRFRDGFLGRFGMQPIFKLLCDGMIMWWFVFLGVEPT